jgi:hypothetical protein
MEKIPLESITLFPHTFTTWASAELAIFLAMVQEPPPGTCLHFAIRWTNGSVYTGDIPFSLDEAGGAERAHGEWARYAHNVCGIRRGQG